MKPKPVIPRALADRDIQAVIDFYLSEQAEQAALAFVDMLEQTFLHIGRHPAAGSLRYAHELGLPDLRFWPVKRFPYLVFYLEREEHIDVWRVLHAERDIPTWMQGPK
jgi:toxin ParE1/3/4